MATLTDGDVFIVPNTGIYSVAFVMSAGTAKIELSLDKGVSYTDMSDSSVSATTTFNVEATQGSLLRAALTGDATMQIDG